LICITFFGGCVLDTCQEKQSAIPGIKEFHSGGRVCEDALKLVKTRRDLISPFLNYL
jgi:hypothetical protein